MKEFALLLSAMTAPHHQWPMKPPEPVAVVRRAPIQPGRMNAKEWKKLKRAVDTFCRHKLPGSQARGFQSYIDVEVEI
jgi:hypothetical protein